MLNLQSLFGLVVFVVIAVLFSEDRRRIPWCTVLIDLALQLVALPSGALSERSELIMLYALCGFANFGSLGIMLGGMGTMVPERRAEIAALGLKSIIAGTLATLMTGAWVGAFTRPGGVVGL